MDSAQREKWYVMRTRHVPAVWPLHAFWAWPVHTFFNTPTSGTVMSVWDKGDYKAIYAEQETRVDLANAIAKKMLKEFSDAKEFRQQGIRAGEIVTAFCRAFAQRSADASLSDFVTFLDAFTIENAAFMRDNMFYWTVGLFGIEEALQQALGEYAEVESKAIIEAMSLPSETSYSKEVEHALCDLTALVREKGAHHAESAQAIKKFSQKYFWFPYEYVGPAIWDEAAVSLLVEKQLALAPTTSSPIADIQTSQTECIAKHHLPESTLRLFTIIQTLALMQDDRKRYNSEISYYLNGVILPSLGIRLGISREEALYLDQDLIREYERDKNLFAERLANRVDMTLEITENGVYTFYEGRAVCEALLEKMGLETAVGESVQEVRGQVAYKGKVRGRVRVLKSSQVSDFADGDILVTGMTTPDFAFLMKQAGAIVTDEGGITCHAAIVSRELKKPCIIGTKIATQVFKDGDLVEVDADSGIVKKLKRPYA